MITNKEELKNDL